MSEFHLHIPAGYELTMLGDKVRIAPIERVESSDGADFLDRLTTPSSRLKILNVINPDLPVTRLSPARAAQPSAKAARRKKARK